MTQAPKKRTPNNKTLHPRNRHREHYDFDALCKTCPELSAFVFRNAYDQDSIDFANAEAVKMLNRALLMHFYGIRLWDIPAGYLCPPIPGRADYIHCIADHLAKDQSNRIPRGSKTRVLDIGVGANCVYPIIGHHEYGWSFVGTDIDPLATKSAEAIVKANPALKNAVEIRLQPSRKHFFKGIVKPGEYFDLSICNPPFHASQADADARNRRKWKNLGHDKKGDEARNFGGQNAELWCPGGERKFVEDMVKESVLFQKQVKWFSTLISKKTTLPLVYKALKRAGAKELETIPMAQGQKVSRIVLWTFL